MSLPDNNLGNPMPLTDRAFSASIATVHPAVHSRVNRLQVLRTAAGVRMAPMVHVLTRHPMQRLVNEAVHLPKPTGDTDLPISAAVSRSGPEPAFAVSNEAAVQANEFCVLEHSAEYTLRRASLQAGSVHDGAGRRHRPMIRQYLTRLFARHLSRLSQDRRKRIVLTERERILAVARDMRRDATDLPPTKALGA